LRRTFGGGVSWLLVPPKANGSDSVHDILLH
jgi:hypothetical protein